MEKEKYQIVQDEILGNWLIVMGEWEEVIAQDEHYDPFESELEASTWAMENLK
jgi:hypothetical protein